MLLAVEILEKSFHNLSQKIDESHYLLIKFRENCKKYITLLLSKYKKINILFNLNYQKF